MRATAQAWPRAIHRGRRHSPPCAWRVAARPPPPCAAASAMDRYPAARRHGDPAPGPALAAGAAEGPLFSHIRFWPYPRASLRLPPGRRSRYKGRRRRRRVEIAAGAPLPGICRRAGPLERGLGLVRAAPRAGCGHGAGSLRQGRPPAAAASPPRPPSPPRPHFARPPARRNPYSAPAQPASGSGRPSGPRPGNFPGPSPAAPSRIRQLDPAARPVGRRPGCARGRCRRPGRGGAPVVPHASTAAGGGPPRRSAAPRRRRRSAGRRVSPPQ